MAGEPSGRLSPAAAARVHAFPDERVSLETALRAFTVNNAWAAAEEDLKCRIVPGLLADLVILDRDPFGVELGELKDLVVEKTIVGGRVVFDASRP